MPKLIELSLNPAGNLVLLNGGMTEAGNILSRKVDWKKQDQKIESFKIVRKAPGGIKATN